MTRLRCPIASLAAILVVAGGATANENDDLHAAFEAMLETELVLEPLASPDDEQLQRVLDATESTVATIEEVRLFTGRLASEDPDGEASLLLASAPIDGEGDDATALVAVGKPMRWRAGAILDLDGDAMAEWSAFLRNMRFAPFPSLDDARPPSWLMDLRDQLQGDDDEQAHLTLALIRLQEHMNEQASVFNIPRRTNPLAPHEQFSMMREKYEETAGLSDALAPLLGDQADEFVRIAEDSAEAAAEMIEPATNGDFKAFRETQARITANCKSCHFMEGHAATGHLNDAAKETRRRLGIGGGFWKVGYDLRISHADRERSQRVADALRLAVLMLDAASRSDE